ncbi:MAG: methyltransferase [Calditrichaeota bacterium]|nr:MAG: methyltransferase [Calditrichota bacterium]
MTSRQRILTTLRHEEPDKIPIDLGGMGSTGIMAIAYNKLKQHLGFPATTTRISDITQQLAEIEREILDYFEVDVISLENSFQVDGPEWLDWQLPDGSPAKIHSSHALEWRDDRWVLMDGSRVAAQMPPACLYFESCNPPLENAISESEIHNHPWPFFTDEKLRRLEQKAKQLYEETDYAIMGNFGGSIVEYAESLRGWANFMLDLVANPDFVSALLGKMTEVHLKNLQAYLQAVGPYIQIIQMGDDLGAQNAPQFSPDLYRELIKPFHKQIYQYARQQSNAKVFLHSCGSIYDFIPDLIDAGVDIFNPVQFTAAKMETQKLKQEFGDRITFWGGGVDTQHVLPCGTPEEIAEQVAQQFYILAPGGGYVFSAVHNIQANVLVENILALFEAVKNGREYPVG